jgi:hypothetical protein
MQNQVDPESGCGNGVSASKADGKGQNIVIACRVMEPELSHVVSQEGRDNEGTRIVYLEHALHRTPDKLLIRLREKIGRLACPGSRIVLGYGLCARGIEGIAAGAAQVVIPRCHDCIALFLGSPDRYLEVFRNRPGTYYLTAGWIAGQQDPLALIEEHVPRYGRKTAQWIIEEELRNYTHIALIDTGVGEMASLRARAMENAALLKKGYEEIEGSLAYFRELLHGPHADGRFIHLRPGEELSQGMVISNIK